MFDMLKVGKKIASLRKEKNMTQLELADQLGISYQAVSHWERGASMPDISKLGELAQIFETSIDQILEHKPLVVAVEEVLRDQKIDAKLHDSKTLSDVIPMMKPKEIESSIKDIEDQDPRVLLSFAPFLDEEEVDAFAYKAYEKNASIELIGLAPFMSKEGLSKIAHVMLNKDQIDLHMLPALAPFLDEDTLDVLATATYQKYGTHSIASLLPFMSSELIDHLIKLEVDQGHFDKIQPLIPFASRSFKKKMNKQDKETND